MSWASQAVRTDEMLVTAATRGEYDRVKQYLDHGAVSSARNHHLLTALHWAVTMGHIDVVQVRVRPTAPPSRPPAHFDPHRSTGSPPAAQLLVDRGADVDAKAADGNSPLHMAAREGDLPCAEFLIGAGADPCGLNSQSQTPLDLANVWAEEELELLHLLRQATQAKAQRQRLGGGSARWAGRPLEVRAARGSPAPRAAARHPMTLASSRAAGPWLRRPRPRALARAAPPVPPAPIAPCRSAPRPSR